MKAIIHRAIIKKLNHTKKLSEERYKHLHLMGLKIEPVIEKQRINDIDEYIDMICNAFEIDKDFEPMFKVKK
jgi:hypothetical protein